MTRKSIIISWVIVACIFFVIGRFTSNKISKITNTVQNTNVENKKSTQVDVSKTQKVVATRQQTSYIEKSFNDKGILIKEVIFGENNGADMIESDRTVSRSFVQSKNISEMKSSTITDYKTNWGLGISIPTKIKPTSVNLMLAYRVLDNLYLTASANTNLKETNTQLGFIWMF